MPPPPVGVIEARRRSGSLARLAFILVATAIVALGLAGFIGQPTSWSEARAADVTLRLKASDRLRGGLYHQLRIEVRAGHRLEHPALVLGPGWLDDETLNGIIPDPAEQSSRDGRLVLRFDPLAAGERLVVLVDLQVNPTDVTRRTVDVAVEDGGRPLARLTRDLVVFP